MVRSPVRLMGVHQWSPGAFTSGEAKRRHELPRAQRRASRACEAEHAGGAAMRAGLGTFRQLGAPIPVSRSVATNRTHIH